MDTWVPGECALPTAEQPLRVAELDDLLARSLRRQERVARTHLRWSLAPGVAAAAAELTSREAACCSFFRFRTGVADDGLVRVDVLVPAAFAGVLDALEARAGGGSGAWSGAWSGA